MEYIHTESGRSEGVIDINISQYLYYSLHLQTPPGSSLLSQGNSMPNLVLSTQKSHCFRQKLLHQVTNQEFRASIDFFSLSPKKLNVSTSLTFSRHLTQFEKRHHKSYIVSLLSLSTRSCKVGPSGVCAPAPTMWPLY